METKKYSEWTQDEKNSFLTFVQNEISGLDAEDICIAGSFIWEPKENSDLDAVVYVDQPESNIVKGSYIEIRRRIYDNRGVHLFIVPLSRRGTNCYVGLPVKPEGLALPVISMLDGQVYGDLNHPDIDIQKSFR